MPTTTTTCPPATLRALELSPAGTCLLDVETGQRTARADAMAIAAAAEMTAAETFGPFVILSRIA